MRATTTRRLVLPARRTVTRLWLENLAAENSLWEREAFERLALRALADFYCFLDEKSTPGLFRLEDLLSASIAPDRLALIDLTRLFLALRTALRTTLLTYTAETRLGILEALDAWIETIVEPYSSARSQQLLRQKSEIAQRMAELNMLNHCAVTLSATLDSVSAYQAAAHLARLLTNADLSIIFQKVDDYLWPRASAGEPPCLHEPVQIAPQFLEPVLIDREHRKVSIRVARRVLGVPGVQALISTPLRVGDKVIGTLVNVYNTAQAITPQQARLLEIFSSHVAQAVYNAQLYERLVDLTTAQERQRIACEMHDTMLQTLVSLNITLQVALGHVRQEHWSQAAAVMEEARQLGKLAMEEGRQTLNNLRSECCNARENLISALRPERALFSELSGVTPRLVVGGDVDSLLISRDVVHHLRRLVGEALTNIYRHARATEVSVEVGMQGQELCLSVRDNGVGFLPDTVDQNSSFGLIAMRERSRLIEGQLEVQSTAGQGTVVCVRVPCRRLAASRNQTFTD